MNELVRTLQTRIKELERDNARYDNARRVLCIELEYWRAKALGVTEFHPDSELGKLRKTQLRLGARSERTSLDT